MFQALPISDGFSGAFRALKCKICTKVDDIGRNIGQIIGQVAIKGLFEVAYSCTNKQYKAMTGVSENIAMRDLDALVAHGSLRTLGKRRSRQYRVTR
jgi:Fic family protein